MRSHAGILFALLLVGGLGMSTVFATHETAADSQQSSTRQPANVPPDSDSRAPLLPATAAGQDAARSGATPPVANPPEEPPPERPALPAPLISFDFDDGFASAYENALPIFDAAGFKTTQYIVSGYLGWKGYVTAKEVLAMQADGHEIGAHTRTHPHLPTLSPEAQQNEILGSKTDLEKLGARIATFAYPYGEENAAVEDLVQKDGFAGARITQPGLNDSSTDPYRLWYMDVTTETTLPMIETEIDTDIAKKKWLILVFHRVDDPEKPGVTENIPASLVQGIVDYVKSKDIRVVTNAEGLRSLPTIR